MKFFSRSLLLCFLLVFSLSAIAQTVKFKGKPIDTATTIVWTGAGFSYQLPFGEMGKTFKPNYNLSTGVNIKTVNNWTFDLFFNYCFGSDIKDSTFLGDVLNSNGDIIDGNGLKATVYLEGRYWTVGAGLGKIIPVNRWRNSGIWLHAGAGFFQHKIHFTDPDNQCPQIFGDYRKGYDRRSSGFCLSQFVGYVFMQRVRVASFYAGIEIFEIWSKPDRNYIFYEGPTANMQKKFSCLLGLKLGWIIPLYENKKVVTFYQD